MRTKFTLITLLAAGLTASAAPTTMSITKVEGQPSSMLQRTDGKCRITPQADIFSPTGKNTTPVFATPQRLVEGKYGTELEPIIYEDFSLMTTGTIEEPDWSADIIKMAGDEDYEYFWNNMKDGFTHTPGWGGQFIYPAGGCAYLDANSSTQTAGIVTPRVDISGHDAVAVLRFKARTLPGMTSDYLLVESAETHDWGPEWDVLASGLCPTVTEEWQTYEVIVQNGGPTTLFTISANAGIEVILDDIEIFQYDLYVGIPVLHPHSNYQGSSFDLSWDPVEGADGYLVNLYSADQQTGAVSYLYKDEPVEGTTWTATGTESGLTYYYTVRAFKGDYTGIESLPVEIYDLECPTLDEVAQIYDDGLYEATWSTSPSAVGYSYWAYADRTATQDGEFLLTEETYTGLLETDGSAVERTVEKPDYMVYDEYYPNAYNQGGWKLRNGAPCTDYVVVDVWHYINGNGDSGLISPEFDLSKDGGKVSVSLSLLGELVKAYDWDNNEIEVQTGCAVALFNWNEEIGDYSQAELVYVEGVTPAWEDYTVELTKGAERSIIGIYGVTAPGNLYIDNLRITQNYKTGEQFRDPFFMDFLYPDTQIEITIPERGAECDIWHKVSAVKVQVGSDGINQVLNYKSSAYTPLQYVGKAPQSGIETATLALLPSARVNAGMLNVANPAGQTVNIFDLSGRLIASDASGAAALSIALPDAGIYVVKVGNTAIKVIR